MEASVSFLTSKDLPFDGQLVWKHLTDWEHHGKWIPSTTVTLVPTPDTFTAYSGKKPLILADTMKVVRQVFDGQHGTCELVKLGPILFGNVYLSVHPAENPDHSIISWQENLVVRHTPSIFGGHLTFAGKKLFAYSMVRFEKYLQNLTGQFTGLK